MNTLVNSALEVDAAPPAGGAGAALEAPAATELPGVRPRVLEAPALPLAPDDPEEVGVAVPFLLALVVGPTALALTVET